MAVGETMRPHWMHGARSKANFNLCDIPFIHYTPSEAQSDRVTRMTETELSSIRIETHERGAADLFADNVRLTAELEAALAERDTNADRRMFWFRRSMKHARTIRDRDKTIAAREKTIAEREGNARWFERQRDEARRQRDEALDARDASRGLRLSAEIDLRRDRAELERVRLALDKAKTELSFLDLNGAFDRCIESGDRLRAERDDAVKMGQTLERAVRYIGWFSDGEKTRGVAGSMARGAIARAGLDSGPV